jgi:uncharacterized protein YxeA
MSTVIKDVENVGGFFTSFFTNFSKYLIILLVILLGISVTFNVIYHFDRASLIQDNANLTQKVNNLNTELKTSNSALADQNTKLDAANSAAKDAQTKLTALQGQINAKEAANSLLIKKMMNTPAPTNCADTQKYLQNNLGLYQW